MRLEDVRVGMRVRIRSEAGPVGTVVDIVEEAIECPVLVELDDGTLWGCEPDWLEPEEESTR